MAINVLDSLIINRISAGEVVESPFSIVKELLDNSIDAGATKITVEIQNGGIDQIIVKDNGKGIEHDDMIKAFLPHATSKIKDISDLEAISTLGFRGEALASISNVSKTTLLTKTSDSDCAYSLDVFGGIFGEIMAAEGEVGTKIEVNNLFYNTPARRKFLKKPKQEESQITNIVIRYMMAHPTISFKYVVDSKTIYHSKGNSLQNTITSVYGDDIIQNIMPIQKEIGNLSVNGFVSKVGYSKPNTTYQTLIINSRYVVDEIVSKAVYMAFEEYLMPRQFPFYVLNLTMPMIDIDVNVHPSKMNVKFANPSKIYDLIYTAVRSKIFASLNNEILENKPKSINTAIENSLIKTDLNSLKEIEVELNTNIPEPNSKILTLKQDSYSPMTIFDLNKNLEETKPQTETKSSSENDQTYVNVSNLADFKIVGEIFNEFIILEKENNMLLLDFHAGHERLNYDKFKDIVKNRQIVIQDLLVPYIQTITEPEVEYILSLKTQLTDLGFEIEQFGEKQIIISSIPMQLKDINLKNFVDDLLHDMKNIKPKMNNEIDHYLMQKACKSSVKSGMKLSEMEIKELLKNLDINKPVLLCPHGRPIISVVSKSQIEKWFKRIVWQKY